MTDSTIDENSGDGGFDVGASADDLFGAIADESIEGAVDRESANAADDADEKPNAEAKSAGGRAGAGGVEDQTASNVFGQLKADADVASTGDGTDDVLEGESPEDIIASADEPDPETESTVDDDLLVDEDELEDLLLTGRTKDQEFLWIDPDGSPADESDGSADVDADIESEGADESASELFEESEPDALEDDSAEPEGEDDLEPEPESASEDEPESEDEDETAGGAGLVIADKPTSSPSTADASTESESDTDADPSADAADAPGLLGRLRSVLSLFLP